VKLKFLVCCLLGFAVHAEDVRTLRGGGLEVSVDLTGWKQSGGPGVLHESYVRLGTFDTDKAHLSFLVDLVRPGEDLKTLCEGTARHHAGGTILEASTFAGKPACLISASPGAPQSDLYFEMIVGNRWLEWHYSAAGDGHFIEAGRKALEPLVASLAAKVEAVPTPVPESDMTDAEVSLIERSQKCKAESKELVCRALAAFKVGKRPSGRPQPVSIVGATVELGFGGSSDAPPEFEGDAGYLVLSDTAARQEEFRRVNKKDLAASNEVVAAVKLGKHAPANNLVVAAARKEHDAPPAKLAERSLLIPNEAPGKIFLRETTVGLVSVELASDEGAVSIVLGIYPAY